jgi:hypothetical protein
VGVIKQIAQSLGEILGNDKRNAYSEDQWFCIALLSSMPYETILGIINPMTGERSEIVIDYNNLSIRCRYYMATDHLIKDCAGLNEGKTKDQEGNPVNIPAPSALLKSQVAPTGSGRRGSGPKANPAQQKPSMVDRISDRRYTDDTAQSREDNEAQTKETQEVRGNNLGKDTQEAHIAGPTLEENCAICNQPKNDYGHIQLIYDSTAKKLH